MTLAMEAVDQADQAVDQADQAVDQADQAVNQAVQPVDPDVQVEEYLENNADEAVNLQFDFDSDVDDLYMCSDCEEDPACDFTEEEPHSDAKRKLAEWAANCQVSHSALRVTGNTLGARSGCTRGSQNSPQYQGRTGHLAYRAFARWADVGSPG
ncbi:hypothetical protein D5F01_LYC08913 [Larimichthys crocea]|uniref:Uncharacterized protein n=1 Tax=Larimichthys crocea TaxID=215358 RepID=A0A6G0IJ70_LARCR|nr:hypothetical protein D5F01_LYC08913 [Larimichthys crocea]